MRASLFLAGLTVFALAPALGGCSGGEANTTTGSGGSTTSSGAGAGGSGVAAPPWLTDAKMTVSGEETNNGDCRTDICRHSENTDLINWNGAIFLVHRTANSQILGPNSSLRISKSTDGGKTFALQAVLPAVMDRDIRDPHFYVVGNELRIKALARLAVMSTRDSDVDTIALGTSSTDGKTWSDLAPIGPNTWSFWRIKEQAGVYYSAAYEDGDKSVKLFSSTDGVTWTPGAVVYSIAADTPLETELTFMPSGKLLALVRMDGTDEELLGDQGRLRTKICWADAPYTTFACPDEFMGERLDGPLSFFHDNRLFMVARKHLGADDRKRTALYEITGTLEGGPLSIKEWGELPSAGDTSYAGVAKIDDGHSLVTWYSGNIDKDEGWAFGMFDVTDIWQATIDFSKLK
jgi:hypothetical protein